MSDDQPVVWGYVRLSQDGREGTLDEQKRQIREYANDHGFELQTTRNEGRNTSGFNADRDEYQLLREKIRSEEINGVITRDRARMSRDFDDRVSLIVDLRTSGVEWHVIETGGRLGLDDVQTAAMEMMHAAMDHIKKKMEIQRSVKATEERIEKGLPMGLPPIGLQYGPHKEQWVPDDNFEAALRALELRDDGHTYREIASKVDAVSKDQVGTILDRREEYEGVAERTSEKHSAEP